MFAAALIFTAALLKPSYAACTETISCPCGTSNKTYTFCSDGKDFQENSCARWSFCETCRNRSFHCVTCPPGRYGPLCTTTDSLEKLKRAKRYYSSFRIPGSLSSPQSDGREYIRIGNCPAIRGPEHGAIKCTEFRNKGECVGTCIPGYSFEGAVDGEEMKLQCRFRQWSPRKDFPPCKSLNFCKLVSGLTASSFYNCTEGMDGKKCDIRCNGKYQGRFSCYPPGNQWTPSLPYCVKALDPGPSASPPCDCLYGGTCDSRGVCACPVGRIGTLCEEAEWVKCPDPGTPRGGYRTHMDGSPTAYGLSFDVGNALIYSCPPRHVLTGAQTITCMRDGTWSALLPRCIMNQVRSCPEPGPVPFAKYNPSPQGVYEAGDTVKYECQQGFVLEGSPLLTCLRAGYWNGRNPACKRMATTTETPTITDDPGFPCTHPGVDRNGAVNGDLIDARGRSKIVVPPGTRLSYSCDGGYELVGNDVIICLRTGRWSDPKPTCKKIKVSPPAPVTMFCLFPGVPNSRVFPKVEDDQVPALTQLHIFCSSGYELKGPEVLLCQPNGMWSNVLPTCEPLMIRSPLLRCPRPEMDPNAYIDDSILDARSGDDPDSYVSGSFVRIKCNDGFVLSGDEDVLYCLNTGSWNKAAPVCERKPTGIVFCENVEFTAHGQVDVYRASSNQNPVRLIESRSFNQMYPPGTQLYYRCNEGYHIKGTELLVCEPFGDWSDNAPACVKDISCPALVIRHGGLKADLPSDVQWVTNRHRYPEKTTLTVTCNPGYALDGAETLNCTPNGEWSDEPPVCVEDCGVSPLSATKRIGYATPTQAGEWPWMVAISRPSRGGLTIVCGGALLDGRTVLTAAHCFENQPYYVLQFGKYNRSNAADDDGVVVRQSSDIVLHSGYVRATYANDIALVRLNSSVPYNNRILPICLPSPETAEEDLQPGNQGIIAGWGLNEMDVSPTELMMARLKVLPAADCEADYRRMGVEVSVGEDRFCAGSRQARNPNACQGDSGSPLVFYSNDTGKFTAEGVVSASPYGECGRTGRITLFTKIAFYMDWIQENWKRAEL